MKFFKNFFRLLYSGRVNDVKKVVCELSAAAEKYSVEGLKELCENTMINDFNEDNAIEYLNLAIINNAEKLNVNVMNWMTLHI